MVMMILLLLMVQQVLATSSYSCQSPKANQVLPFCLPEEYLKHLPPPTQRDEPIAVHLHIRIRDVTLIDDLSLTAELQLFLDMYWVEPRLNLTQNRSVWDKQSQTSINPDLLDVFWVPDLDVWNLRTFHINRVLYNVGSLEIYPNKTICPSFGVRLVLECYFEFESYPLDTQRCPMLLGSYVYDAEEMTFTSALQHYTDNQRPLQYHLSIRPLNPDERFTYEYDLLGNLESNFSIAGGVLEMRRIFLPHFFRTYLPSGIIVVASWLSFVVDPQVVAGRMALLITNLLVLINLSIGLSSTTPRASTSVTAVELWVLTCIMFVGLALIEYGLILKIDRNKGKVHPKEGSKSRSITAMVDQAALVVFPIVFGLFNFVYWSSYT